MPSPTYEGKNHGNGKTAGLMKLLFTLARQYPWRTLLTMVAITFASISEGFGISALLPLLNTVFNQKIQASGGVTPALSSLLDQAVQRVLAVIGLSTTVLALLSLFVGCIILKCILLYLANKQIGYTVALIATASMLRTTRSGRASGRSTITINAMYATLSAAVRTAAPLPRLVA